MAISIDAQAAINEIAKDLERAERSRDDVTPVGFYGEDETYGTQSDWLTGEGLTSAWGTDPGWGLRSTYSNPVAEYLGEDPVTNLLVDAKGMLQRGGKPSGWDYANLALSTVPVAGQAAVKAITPLATATKKAIQDWGKRKHKYVDFDVDQHITATTDPTFKATGFRDTLQGKILERLGMLPAYKDLVKMQKNADPMIQGWYDDYVLKGKTIDEVISTAMDDVELFSPTERALYEAHMRGGKTAEEAAEATLDAITAKDEFIADWLPGFKKSIDDNLTDWTTLQKTTTELPENVTRLGAKPIQDMTWREWDNLSDETFGGAHGKLSTKQRDIMRAQGITNPDNILDHFWDKGARKEFVDALEQNVDALESTEFERALEFVRTRDLSSGYLDEMNPEQLSNDLAWKHLGDEFDEMFRGTTEPLAVAQKMGWKPDSISHQDWAQFTQNMTMKEVENAYRRLTMKLID